MDITVTDAVLIANTNGPNMWVVAKTINPDIGPPVRLAHAFAEDIIEWRVAEYDMDPNDRDSLLEMILFEPHLDDGVNDEHPLSLLNAPTIADARDFHRSRINTKKGNGKVNTRKRAPNENAVANSRSARFLLIDSGNDPALPLDILKREMPIDPEIVEVKKEHIRLLRQAVRSAGRPSSTELRARPSAEELRQRLIGRDEHRQ